MASYATVVTLAQPVTGHALVPSRSTTIQTTTDPATQAAITAAVRTAMSGFYVPQPDTTAASTGDALVLNADKSGYELSPVPDLTYNDEHYVPQGGLPATAPAKDNAAAEQIVSNFESGSGVAVTGASAYNANDTADFVTGTQSVQATTDGAGSECKISLIGMPATDTTDKFIKIRFKLDSKTHFSALKLRAGSGGMTDYWEWIISQITDSGDTVDVGYWQVDTLNFQHPSKHGSPVRSNITDWALVLTDDAGGAVTVHLDGINVVDNGVAIWPQGVLSITFDDCYDGQWLYARPAMDKYGYRGTSYPIWERFGQAGRMTVTEALQLQDVSGWEFGSHAATAALHDESGGFSVLSDDALAVEFASAKKQAYAQGFRGVDHFAWPQSKYTHESVVVARRYFASARTTFDQSGFETFPPANPLYLRSWSIHNDYTPASVLAFVASAMQHRTWIILDFHQIAPSDPGVAPWYGSADFQTLMDGIAALGIPVRTIGEVLGTKRNVGGAHASSSLGWFGDGSDYIAAFDGTTAVVGASLSGSTYTLTRDAWYTNVQVSAGITVDTARFRLFARDSLVNNGSIINNGTPAAGATAGASKSTRTAGGGSGGGNGSAGGTGVVGVAAATALGGSGGAGGIASGGGTGGGTAGGAASSTTSNGAPRHAQAALACAPQGSATLWLGGAGGAGGSADTGATGGGGGGGGPVMIIAARVLINLGTISAKGGAGAAGALGTGTGAGGGGGGGGGALLLVINTLTNSGTLDVSGGAGGAGAGVGAAGAAGSPGAIYKIRA